jgi:hypothetical protein
MHRFTAAVACLALSLSAIADPGKPSAEDAKAKVDALKAAMKSGTDDEKKNAIAAAGSVAHPACVAALGGLLTDKSEEIRAVAAGALGQMKGLPEAARALAGAVPANVALPMALTAICKSIGAVNHPAAVPVLKEFVNRRVPTKEEADAEATAKVIDALAMLKFKASVEVFLDLYTKQVGVGMECDKGKHAAVYQSVRRGLEGMSGQTFGMPGDAKAWWSKHEKLLNDDLTPKKK